MGQIDYSLFADRRQAETFLQKRYELSLGLLFLSQVLVGVGLFLVGNQSEVDPILWTT